MNRIIRADRNGIFRFASLQSEAALGLLESLELRKEELPDSIVLVMKSGVRVKSRAAFGIASRLPGLFRLISIFKFLPTPLADRLYDFVATHRYRWFGKRDECMIPTKDVLHRFLEDPVAR